MHQGKILVPLTRAPHINQAICIPQADDLVWSHGASTAVGLEFMNSHQLGSPVSVDFPIINLMSSILDSGVHYVHLEVSCKTVFTLPALSIPSLTLPNTFPIKSHFRITPWPHSGSQCVFSPMRVILLHSILSQGDPRGTQKCICVSQVNDCSCSHRTQVI